MSRFSPGDRVEWVSPSGMRRVGAVVEALPGRQYAVRPDGCSVEQAVGADALGREVGRVEIAATVPVAVVGFPERPAPAPRPGNDPATTRPTADRRCTTCFDELAEGIGIAYSFGEVSPVSWSDWTRFSTENLQPEPIQSVEVDTIGGRTA